MYTGGFVNVLAINRARGTNGIFYFSMSPDIYSAIALASVLDNYVVLKEPISIAGISSHSNGTSCLGIGKNLMPAKKFFSEGNIPFHSMLAGGEVVKSIPILVYESYLQSKHLHNDFLNVELKDQLTLALADVASKNYIDLRKYCNQIAHVNGIDMDAVDREIKKKRKELFLQGLKLKPNQKFKQLTISGQKFGVKDVYGASFLANAAFILETRYVHWKLDNFFRLMKKVAKFIIKKIY